jgi:hypothetical protein
LAKPGQHRLGKGTVIWGKSPEQVLADANVAPDFAFRGKTPGVGLRYIHRTVEGMEIYFVANKNPQTAEAVCAFRAAGRRPELWYPDTGRIERVAVYDEAGGVVRVPIHFDPVGSVFVIFKAGDAVEPGRITSVLRDGKPILETTWSAEKAQAAATPSAVNTFTMAVWANPAADTALPRQANAGVFLNDPRNDALYPVPGHEVGWPAGHAGTGLSIGRNGVCVYEHSADYFAPPLVCAAPITNWTHVAVVYRDGVPSLYLNGKLAATGLKSTFQVHSGVGVEHGRGVVPFRGELGDFQQAPRALSEADLAEWMKAGPTPARRALPAVPENLRLVRTPAGQLTALAPQPGAYTVQTASGQTLRFEVPVGPAPQEITGPWPVQFEPQWGGPAAVTFAQLDDWSKRPEEGIRHYSGAAVYRKTFVVPDSALRTPHSAFHLDLGKVAVMAEVRLNGKDLGILWKPPFRVDVTGLLKAGDNQLEVKVVNLWINRQIGDEALPEDSDRNANGTLKEWPKWLDAGQPSPAGRYTFTSWRLYKQGDPLVESGLLGPVTLQTATQMNVP